MVFLIITIIIMLILTGVVISLAINKNGIIAKAEEARKKQAIAKIKESISLDLLDAQIEANKTDNQIEKEQIKDIVSKYGELRRRWRYDNIKR